MMKSRGSSWNSKRRPRQTTGQGTTGTGTGTATTEAGKEAGTTEARTRTEAGTTGKGTVVSGTLDVSEMNARRTEQLAGTSNDTATVTKPVRVKRIKNART